MACSLACSGPAFRDHFVICDCFREEDCVFVDAIEPGLGVIDNAGYLL